MGSPEPDYDGDGNGRAGRNQCGHGQLGDGRALALELGAASALELRGELGVLVQPRHERRARVDEALPHEQQDNERAGLVVGQHDHGGTPERQGPQRLRPR